MTGPETQVLEAVLAELRSIKTGMPNGELKQILDSQKEMKEDISEMKYTLLNPEDGVVVKVNRNTDFRKISEANMERYQKHFDDVKEIKEWKATVTKVLWLLFGAIISILVKTFFYSTTGINM